MNKCLGVGGLVQKRDKRKISPCLAGSSSKGGFHLADDSKDFHQKRFFSGISICLGVSAWLVYVAEIAEDFGVLKTEFL